MKEYNIRIIESLTVSEAKALAEETLIIKDHTVYLVDFGGYFGYSAIVFFGDHHIYHANDYALHHNGKDKQWLRKWYIDTMNHKLYTENEIVAPLRSYNEYTAKGNFLRNYYPMRVDYVSCFHIIHNEEEATEYERKIKDLYLNPISFCYMADKDFISHHVNLHKQLEERKSEMSDNYDYYVSAFKHEMYNHEYGINWQADYDVLSVFGNIKWHGEEPGELNKYFDECGFNATQRKAYYDARRQYNKETEDNW